MDRSVVGLDFGTTNSLIAYIDHDERPRTVLHTEDNRPHPSTVWYRAGEVIVGRNARKHLEGSSGAVAGAFVRSPKKLLFRDSAIDIDGTRRDPVDVVAEVFRFLKEDAAASERGDAAIACNRVILTIPVDLDGDGRRRVREAARKAEIGVVQFVHEPLAALYAWLRSYDDLQTKIDELEGRRILVFDWGGGTLDLTLCVIEDRQLLQLKSVGDNDVGGDLFDELIRNHVRELHAQQFQIDDIEAYETTDSKIRLLTECELAKIRLTERDSRTIFVPNYLRTDIGKHLEVTVTREQLETWTRDLVAKGLSHIDRLLESQGLTHQEIELCLPTGGMVNLPAVRAGLVERFGGRVPLLENGDRIIAEGAAWIAHDALRLNLAKPIEIQQPDGSFVEIVGKDVELPFENQSVPLAATQFYCVDPRDGVAHFQFVRPTKVGYGARSCVRKTYTVLRLNVDPNASPLIERLNLNLQINHDYVVSIEATSSGRGHKANAEIHDLEFALTLPKGASRDVKEAAPDRSDPEVERGIGVRGAVHLRSNVTARYSDWASVPGDIVDRWRPHWFDVRSPDPTPRQKVEKNYYLDCTKCRRNWCAIQLEGCEECDIHATVPRTQERLGSGNGLTH